MNLVRLDYLYIRFEHNMWYSMYSQITQSWCGWIQENRKHATHACVWRVLQRIYDEANEREILPAVSKRLLSLTLLSSLSSLSPFTSTSAFRNMFRMQAAPIHTRCTMHEHIQRTYTRGCNGVYCALYGRLRSIRSPKSYFNWEYWSKHISRVEWMK